MAYHGRPRVRFGTLRQEVFAVFRCNFAVLLGLATIALLPTACSGDGEQGSKGDKGGTAKTGGEGSSDVESDRPHWEDRGDTLIYGVGMDADGLCPILYQSVTGGNVVDLVTPRVTNSDFANGRITFLPALAKSWEWSEDHTKLTYTIRDDAVWDDPSRTIVSGEDFVFTYMMMRDPDVASPRGAYTERMDPQEPVTLLPDGRVRFNFLYAYNEQTMLAHAGMNLIPKHLLTGVERKAMRQHDLHIKNAAGHGPFRLLSWDPKKEIVLVRNKACKTIAVPYLRRIIMRVIPEYQTLLTEMRKGGIDLMESIQEKDIADAKLWGNVKLYRRGYRFLDYVAWNGQNPLFADREVRRALTMAMDLDTMIKNLLTFGGERHGTKAYSTLTPELTDFVHEGFAFLPFDPKKAAAVLDKAGWSDTDGDGVRDKEGKRFEFTLLTNQGNPRRKDACELIQANLKAIGVKANLELREGVTFFDLLRKKEYDAAVSGWSAGLFPDPSDIWHSATEKEPRPYNFTAYSNAEVDKLIQAGLRTADLTKEAAIWKRMQKLIYDDQPYTFLYWKKSTFPLHKRFKGVEPNVLSVIHKLENWYVPKADHKYKY